MGAPRRGSAGSDSQPCRQRIDRPFDDLAGAPPPHPEQTPGSIPAGEPPVARPPEACVVDRYVRKVGTGGRVRP